MNRYVAWFIKSSISENGIWQDVFGNASFLMRNLWRSFAHNRFWKFVSRPLWTLDANFFAKFTLFNKYKDKDGLLLLIWVIFKVREVLEMGDMADVNFCRSALSCQCQTSCKFSSFQNRQKINNCSTIWYGSWLNGDICVTRSQNQRLADFMKCARSVQFAIIPSIS